MSDHLSGFDHVLLILHIGFAIFTLGPLTAATMATPRYIRRGDLTVLRYLRRVTQMYGLFSLGVFLFGMLLARGHFGKMWITASMTLMIVALVLLLIVERDQTRALKALTAIAADRATIATAPQPDREQQPESTDAPAQPAPAEERPEPPPATTVTGDVPAKVADVERGRIASISGVVGLIWIVILILMVWH